MRYISTRGGAERLSFTDAVLEGLAPDGGLYLPESWPELSAERIRSFSDKSFVGIARDVLDPLLGPDQEFIDLKDILGKVAKAFSHPEITPLRQLEEDVWVLELFHGPTLSFKDLAMQFLAPLLEQILKARGERLNIITATSGDTGAAAVHAFKGSALVNLFVLHPENRISDVQRRQMTAVKAKNIFNIAVKGTFDDCQAILKLILRGEGPPDGRLATVNSVNWGRIAAQTVYYFYAASRLAEGGPGPLFAVPSGNFGNAFAGFAAMRMGLKLERILLATNNNQTLVKAVERGTYEPGPTLRSPSPAMDIQRASNFERLLFEVTGRDAGAVRAAMRELDEKGAFRLKGCWRRKIRQTFLGKSISDSETFSEMDRVFSQHGRLFDPHTAVASAALRKIDNCATGPKVILATADAAKFADTVLEATGNRPAVPKRLEQHLGAGEQFQIIEADADKIRKYIFARVA